MTPRVETQRRSSRRSLLDLWDPATGRFDPVALRFEMLIRGLTPDALASVARVGRSSVYKAMQGRGVRDRTAYAILLGLARSPVQLPVD